MNSSLPHALPISSSVPKHVAIIMDGNGRWAEKRKRPRLFGHVRGSAQVKPILKAAKKLGVQALTLYAFSTENWSRPEAELSVLWKLLVKFLRKEVNELHAEGVRLMAIGELDRLPSFVKKELDLAINKLKDNSKIVLTLALSYGGQREIALAMKEIGIKIQKGLLSPDDINERVIEQHLWTKDLEHLQSVDLLIRTSGEKRVSNFLLWQIAYSEFCFVDVSWPDFSPQHLDMAVGDYMKRERRFGGLKLLVDNANQLAVSK